MAKCTDFECYLESIRAQRNRVGSTTGRRSDGVIPSNGNLDLIERNPNMRVIFPVLLVIGIFVILAIGFLIYRFAADYIRKRWLVWRNHGDNNNDERRNRSRSRRRNGTEINTISAEAGFRDRPPSYRQVLASIQQSEPPPSYDTVSCNKFIKLDRLTMW